MRRNIVTLGWILCSLMLVSPALAQEPFGSFGGRSDGGNGAAGIVGMFGWALDDDGVAAVDFYVDGVIDGRALYGRHRPGVEAAYPGFPDSATAGFSYSLDTTRYPNGLHTVTPQVISTTGQRKWLNSRVFDFNNTTHNLVPFGSIDSPLPNTELFGNCDLADPQRRYSVVTGFGLDAGIEIGDSGIGYVELLIDGSIFANSRTDCRYIPETGGLTNCYGLRRLDVERVFPSVRDAPHSGFRFVLDLGFLIEELQYVEGFHVLSIRAGDVAGQVAEIAELPVTFLCDDRVGNEGAFGAIDLPEIGLTFSGAIEFTGWALDWQGVSNVAVWVDGQFQGNAVTGLPRPGVSSQFPGFPESDFPGWSFSLDSTGLSNGFHNFQVIVTDDLGATTMIGERSFTVDNP
ncbi:MAG: Ig-like domain-containing protein [Acidobacteriota bacterium]